MLGLSSFYTQQQEIANTYFTPAAGIHLYYTACFSQCHQKSTKTFSKTDRAMAFKQTIRTA
jgi:hypothetical protein